jgi:hypothetical protein
MIRPGPVHEEIPADPRLAGNCLATLIRPGPAHEEIPADRRLEGNCLETLICHQGMWASRHLGGNGPDVLIHRDRLDRLWETMVGRRRSDPLKWGGTCRWGHEREGVGRCS